MRGVSRCSAGRSISTVSATTSKMSDGRRRNALPASMTLATKRHKTWLCAQCGYRNEPRPRSRKCQNPECGAMSRPIKRRRKHAETLRVDSYDVYCLLSQTIHGGENEACGVCQKPKPDGRKHDRDHDHKTGKPRGLACGGNQGCNILMLPWITAATARAIAEAKQKAGEPDAPRWFLIADYLDRVESYWKGDEG